MQTLDLLHGTQTYPFNLIHFPFLSRLGPNEGEIRIVADRDGRIVDLKVSINSSRRTLFRELEGIAAEAAWDVPVSQILGSSLDHFVVDLDLKADAAQRLAGARIDMDDASLESVIQQLKPLLKDKYFDVANIREVIAPTPVERA